MRTAGAAYVLSAIVFAACGGSDGESERDVAADTPSTVITTAPNPAAAVADYVEEIGEVKRRYDRVRNDARAALDDVNTSSPDESWKKVSDRFEAYRDEWSELAVDAAVIEPPLALSEAHEDLVKSLELNAQFADNIQADLESGEVARIIAWPNTLNELGSRSTELRSHWRTEVKAYARKSGVELPGWVDEVGKAD